ncbi:hypothetical protein HanRHA438_Chr04g0156051 [Helianthus annuus]|nr:hypothetical protein HanIR_Chr04g0157081 [Helianthus annuus]KAJ0925122.1 hypothetical protein HanRHA438_Chr04g0156051 [Helianthus annuus]
MKIITMLSLVFAGRESEMRGGGDDLNNFRVFGRQLLPRSLFSGPLSSNIQENLMHTPCIEEKVEIFFSNGKVYISFQL